MIRTGIGVDTHRFEAGRPLVLGGVDIPHEEGLAGHSDADVLTHAIIDALLGAAGLGDIGMHFPDTDPKFKDADSMELLRTVVLFLGDHGFEILHIDTTIAMERPKIGPFRDAIREGLSKALALPLGSVNLKATTGEGMGFVGRQEGVAAFAVATVEFEPGRTS